jgi:UDP-4-amino-4,6-dideoxy-N-acetyl-beta-L-altrosamine transaminase
MLMKHLNILTNMKPIPYGKQFISDEDIDAVVNTLKGEYLTQGPIIAAFEKAFAEYVGAKYAVALANGTAALHLSTLAIGVKQGDKVITSPITFAASANCVRYCGGEVAFADINPDTFLLDPNKVRQLLEASPFGTYAGIIPVDFAGRPVNIEEFRKLADEFGCWIIEDACHAPGAWIKDSNGHQIISGNGVYADLAIYSFHPVKHIAPGEGGMITTNSKELYDRIITLRTHGITRDQQKFTNSLEFAAGTNSHGNQYPGWYMEMQELGYNYRITDFQAALGITQLKVADKGLARRKAIAKRYDESFNGHDVIVSPQLELKGDTHFSHAYHLYVIRTPQRLALYNYLRTHQIFAQIHYIPAHLMPYYRSFGWKEGDMPHAEKYYQECLSLPMYPSMSDEEQHYVIETILKFFNN